MLEMEMIQKLLLLTLTIPVIEMYSLLTKSKIKLATSKLGGLKDMGKLRGNDGLILSVNFQLNFKKTLEGVCVIAPTGEGKTVGTFLPNVLSNDLPKSSIVIADPKGEIYSLSKSYQEKVCGRRCILFEPLKNQAKYNPIDSCENFTEYRELASNLIQNGELALQMATGKTGGESTFENMAIPLFTAALLNSKTINEAVRLIINNSPEELTEILGNNKNEDIKEQFKIFNSSKQSPKTMSSIISTLLSSLQLFTDHNIINTTSKSTFKPIDLRKQPIALYIKYDEAKSNYLAPFLSVFYSQLIDKIMYGVGLPVLFFLDEFQNIGRIANFPQIVAVSRSKNIGFLVCLQNLVKIYDIYGKNNAMTILNNLKSKCILPSLSDPEALSYISNLCGDTEIKTESTTGDKKTQSATTRKLFTPDEIRRIEDNKTLLILHNKLPFLDEQNSYYLDEKYNKNVSLKSNN